MKSLFARGRLLWTAVLFMLTLSALPGTRGGLAQEGGSGSAGLAVTEAKLGTNVENRELVGEDSTFAVGSKVFLWMKITGGSSDQITVTWKTGEKTHSTSLVIGGSPWRTWATKTLGTSGDWSVSVADTAGNVLKELTFKVQ